ncbi:minor capsid protein [Propionispira raffinosivorans]|uniref:minor capsid protein n=1 Tax=Propionispira raffinosivorans TaxID=86959 RepID=UPI0003633946|nr:minor capsid protein [Propionispira raffinosivorans]
MPNAEYWRGRFEQLELALLDQGLDYYTEVEQQYRIALQAMERDVSVWYKRLAVNNNISYVDAKKLLTANELKEFHWTVGDYIKHGEENNVSPTWIKQLENASAKVHISKLESMKLQFQQSLEVLYGNQLDGLDKTMQQMYADGYYHTAFELQKGIGVGTQLQRLNEVSIQQIVSKPWTPDGKNFSDRVWDNKDKLLNQLHTELTQATIRGDGLDKVIRTLSENMNRSKSAAGKLVMTESAFFASASQKDCFNNLGVNKYEIVATLDRKTSSICRHLDGKVFAMSDFQPGTTAPPFHCWCRSCTAPYFEDDNGKRAARNEKGKTYHVPATMKYEDWKKSFVGNGSKEGLQKAVDNGIKKVVYKEVKTINEANQFATTTLGIKHADYTGLDVQVANEWNRGLTDSFNAFPELRQQFNFTGECHKRNDQLKPVARQVFLDNFIKQNPGIDVERLKPYAEQELKKFMSMMRVPSDVYASSWLPKTEAFQEFAGVAFNKVQGKDAGKLLENLQFDVMNKFHPVGCDTIRSVLDHEVGHQIDGMLGISNLNSVKILFDGHTVNEITEQLSRYAWKNNNKNRYSEFIAEAWSEYCNNPNPRAIAKEIGEIIERKYAEWKKMNLEKEQKS